MCIYVYSVTWKASFPFNVKEELFKNMKSTFELLEKLDFHKADLYDFTVI